MRMRIPAIATVLLGGAAACAPAVPDAPTYVADVQPILLANCVRCHGDAPIEGAPSTFRLDVYDDGVSDFGPYRGAATMAEFVVERAAHQGNMPPEPLPLTTRQQEVLQKWWDTRPAGMVPARGKRAANHEPTWTLLAPTGNLGADQSLVVDYRIDDADGDRVTGFLAIVDVTSPSSGLETHAVHDGRGTITFDTSTLDPKKSYALVGQQITDGDAVLGNGDLPVGGVVVAHASGNTAPAVGVGAPAGAALLSDGDSPFDVAFTATDVEADDVTCDVEAFRGADVTPIATGIKAKKMGNTVPWDLTGVATSPSWRIRVTCTDAKGAKTVARSEYFTVGHGPTTEKYTGACSNPNVKEASIQKLLTDRCAPCHQPAFDPTMLSASKGRIPGFVYDFSRYDDDPMTGATGVHTMRGLIYERVVQKTDMPPVSATTLGNRDLLTGFPVSVLIDDERKCLAEWLLAGAPQ